MGEGILWLRSTNHITLIQNITNEQAPQLFAADSFHFSTFFHNSFDRNENEKVTQKEGSIVR